MAEDKEQRKNPLLHKYGILSNTVYVLRKTAQYCPSAIAYGSADMVARSVAGYFWSIIGKFVLDIVTSDMPQADRLHELLLVIGIGTAIAMLLNVTQTITGNRVWPRYIRARMGMIHERVKKALVLDYELLEQPDMLDIHQRACEASGSNNEGVEGLMHLMQNIGQNLFTLIVCIVAVLVLDWRLVIAMTVLTVVSFLLYRRTIKKDKEEVWDRLMPTWRKINYMGRVTQDFDYAKDIRLFGLQRFLLDKQHGIHVAKEERIDYHHNLWNRYILTSEGLMLIGKIMVYAVLIAAGLSANDSLTVGNFTMYLGFAMSFSSSMTAVLQKFGDYIRESMKVDDFRSFLDQKGDDPEDPLPVPQAEKYTFEFHDVSYHYLKADKDALSGLNLTLSPGEKLAVVGLNGAGKTTMIKLLLRLYEPTSGTITLNGIDIRRFRKAEYYKIFSPVFQNVEVFATTLAENVSMRSIAETDRDRAAACLDQAGLENKLKELPQGLDTQILKVVDENGIDLSGGEKQKLALARALYKDAPVVVLDEPTAALDALAEKQLYERFDGMIGKHSAVYISHRLASTRFCDHIAMFADGHMVEYGTHDELMAKNGEYASMFNVQAQYYKENGEAGDQA